MDVQTDPMNREKKRGNFIQTSSSSAAAADLVTLVRSLPPEIITEILSRLPVKSLLRCRCVSISWNALIVDPIFVKKHLKASQNEEQLLIRYSQWVRTSDVKSVYISDVLNEEFPTALSLHFPKKYSKSDIWIIGSCNGLVCVVIDQAKILLWNPSTRESKKLPSCGYKERASRFIAYGFGYDERNSDYKVIVINCKSTNFTGPFSTQIKIYGLKNGSWRKVKNYPQFCPLGDMGMFVNGTLHWGASIDTGINSYQSILTFDMSEETFSEISQPCFGESVLDSVIWVLNGCLCMLINYHDERKFDLWIMKDYGKTESWTKLFSLPFPEGRMNFQFTPLYITKKNEILMLFGKQLVLFHVESKVITISYPGLKNEHKRCLEALTYTESLASPFPE
ncbi:F-box/kelch-repeat protein At3g23880-like [Impatiens glandulifera]|uniref:F-box/kelch-repeat protein At3g23880-like n=1 Tax=Impatiens glandulifera TaxID=253017 RepID=UPI001FB065AC|nr:F-box/kelch-repeat protein At3g23880-like [Impatiens glandulifera]